MRIRRHVALILTTMLLLAFGRTALAAGPVTQPETVISEGFEQFSLAPELSITTLPSLYPVQGTWGRVTQRHSSGTYGLWCAGSISPSPTATLTYPDRKLGTQTVVNADGTQDTITIITDDSTQSELDVDLTSLSGYYSSRLGFSYIQPSYGAMDFRSFQLAWGFGSKTAVYRVAGFPLTSSFVAKSYDLGSTSTSYNLSRRGGKAFLTFGDIDETGESPRVGEGATIDDLSVTGYHFGPVRSLAASIVSSDVALTWGAPATSTWSSADDTRTIAYHVWRAQRGTSNWVEVTPVSGTQLRSITDTSAEEGIPYKYVVQAFTPDGSGWGELAGEVDVTIGASLVKIPATLQLATSAKTLSYGGSATLSGTLKEGSALILGRNVALQRSYDAKSWTSVVTTAWPAGNYSISQKPSRITYYRLSFGGDDTYEATTSASVKVSPKVYLSSPKVPSYAYAKRSFTSSGYLKPQHTINSFAGYIQCYRYESGTYKLRATFRMYGASSQHYKGTVKLPYRGKWRIRAYHPSDSKNYASYSSYRYLTAH